MWHFVIQPRRNSLQVTVAICLLHAMIGIDAIAQEPNPDQPPVPIVKDAKPESPVDTEPAKVDQKNDETPKANPPESETKAQAQSETTPSKPAAAAASTKTDDRLEKIEKQLAEIGKFLQSMKKIPTEDPAKSATGAAGVVESKSEWSGEISKRVAQRYSLARHRSSQHGWTHHGHRCQRKRPEHLVGGDRRCWSDQDYQQWDYIHTSI